MRETTFWKLLSQGDRNIVIPVNQREYAQGRETGHTGAIRSNFVEFLYQALSTPRPRSLDLIYGSLDGPDFIPFDGQQRLTTLFLLHWLIAFRSGSLTGNVKTVLQAFRYDLREETEKFCRRIIEEFSDGKIESARVADLGEYIKNATWYDAKWERDPSITGMITMLKALDTRFNDAPYRVLWDRLVNTDVIQFFYEEIESLGTTGEELYISMNSRGKELTDFEKFKPKFLGFLKSNYPDQLFRTFSCNLDGAWLDFFWANFGKQAEHKAETTDQYFFNFLWFMFDMLREVPATGEKAPGRPVLEPVAQLYELATLALAPGLGRVWPGHENIEFLKAVLDWLCSYPKPIEDLFREYFYAAGDSGMPNPPRLSWFEANVNLLEVICKNPRAAGNLMRRQMLFGFLLWLVSGQTDRSRLRHLRNLVSNSNDEIGEDSSRAGNATRQILGLSTLILNGLPNANTAKELTEQYESSRYNNRQLQEEMKKSSLICQDATLEPLIEWLENHPFLRGNLSIAYFPHGSAPAFDQAVLRKIYHLFEVCFGANMIDWDDFLRPLLATGAFAWWQNENIVYSKASLILYSGRTTERRNVFTGQAPVEKTRSYSQRSVQEIANRLVSLPDLQAAEAVINNWMQTWLAAKLESSCFDWVWYFVKYPEMLPNYSETLGYYHWNYQPKSFLQKELQSQRIGEGSKNPFLFAVWERAKPDPLKLVHPGLAWGTTTRRENYIAFPCGLTMRAAEFGWLVLDQDGAKPASQNFQILRQSFQELNGNGYFYVPGTYLVHNQTREEIGPEVFEAMDADSDVQSGCWRLCDREDRIELGVKLALKILSLPVSYQNPPDSVSSAL